MSFLRDFFQNLFGDGGNENKHRRFNDHQTPTNAFRNPIWQNNEDNDDEYGDNNRPFPNSNRDVPFQIFTNPFGIMRYLESQMDNIIKFQSDDGVIISEFDDPNFTQILPPSSESENSLRNKFLKPNRALSSSNNKQGNIKIDMDFEGKVTADDVPRIWEDPTTVDNKQLGQRGIVSEPFRLPMSIDFMTRPNVTIEQMSSFTDSAGNTETTVKRQVGDDIHTIITKRNKDGVETKTEIFGNVDESDFGQSSQIVVNKIGTILWDGFFGSDPRL